MGDNTAFAGRSVLVTGGGSGIGFGIAGALAGAGAHVTICGRNKDKLDAAAQSIRARNGAGSVIAVPTDITVEAEVVSAVASAAEATGTLDGVVACAGGNETIAPVTQLDVDAWRRTVDLNVTGTMLTIKHGARALVSGGSGSIVAISSIASSNTHRWFGAYGVSKSGVDHLVQLAADELGPAIFGSMQFAPASLEPIWSRSSPTVGRFSTTTWPTLPRPCRRSGRHRITRDVPPRA